MRKPKNRQPIQTPTNLPYGEAGALATAQRQLPLAGPGLPSPGGPGTPPGGGGFDGALQAAQAMAPPQSPLNAPTDRPAEPITSGVSVGPGPGNEVLPQALAMGLNPTISQMFASLAQRTGSTEMQALAQLAEQAGQ